VAVLEACRLRACELLGQGWSAAQVAEELGVAESTVYGWQRRWRQGGPDALRSTGSRGGACWLSDSQLGQLRQELLRGPEAQGYSTELWTLQRIGQVIWRLFRVRYTESAVWKLLRRMNWSPQRPARRAKERDEERIADWKAKEWPQIKKGALTKGATIVFVDESGFSQRPSVRSTWAPRGCTPVISDHVNWKRLSAIGAVVWRPGRPQTRLFLSLCPGSVKSPGVIDFLRSLRRHIRGPVVLVWDRLAGYRSAWVRDYIHRQKHWLKVEHFPPYAPELNPVEQMWANLRSQELANRAAEGLTEIERVVELGKRRMRRRDLGMSFIEHAELISEHQLHQLRKAR